MAKSTMTLEEANKRLEDGYPPLTESDFKMLQAAKTTLKAKPGTSLARLIPKGLNDFLDPFPFGDYLKKVWITDDRYFEHGPKVLAAMNTLLSDKPDDTISEPRTVVQRGELTSGVETMLKAVGGIKWNAPRGKNFRNTMAPFFRIAALYHDIGKYIISDRHPTVGWYVVQYVDPVEKEKLRKMLEAEDYFQLLLVILRDHDNFGVLSTGEASLPILRGAINSGETLEDKIKIVSALTLCNLADMFGTFDADGEATERMVGDWRWVVGALEHCAEAGLRIDEYLFQAAGRIDAASRENWEDRLVGEHKNVNIPCVSERIRRLLTEASRNKEGRYKARRSAFKNELSLASLLRAVFGSQNAVHEFAQQLAHVCKLDYGLRFFSKLIEYCEGVNGNGTGSNGTESDGTGSNGTENGGTGSNGTESNGTGSNGAESHGTGSNGANTANIRRRLSDENVFYAAIAILKRITTTYAPMLRLGSGAPSQIGVELKDLTPANAPEKTQQIIEMIITSHYPGLTWMMSDVPAWYF